MFKVTPAGATLFWHNQDSINNSFNIFQKLSFLVKFAQNGFYLTTNQSIRCFSCGLQIKNWHDIRNPKIIHMLESPHCEFLHSEYDEVEIFDIQQNYTEDFEKETFLCKICYERPVQRYLVCGHLLCIPCLKRVKACPTCRIFIFDNVEGKGGWDPENS